MSDIYLSELVELDSYWQKAVQDAICETIKGEEKLHNALRNRKNLNEKLKMIGLKPILSKLRFASMSTIEAGSAEEQDSDTESERSDVSMKEKSPDFDSNRSKSGSGDPPCEDDKRKGLTRPLFGTGSLDKIKKSQNSFNCEPMGDEDMSGGISDVKEEEDEDYPTYSRKPFRKERNKKNIQWLHVRNDSDFENSDSESILEDDNTEQILYQKNHFSKNKNGFLNDTVFKLNSEGKAERTPNKYQRKRDSESDSEVDRKSSQKDHQNLERRLHLALAKRDILNKKLKVPGVKSSVVIKVSLSAIKAAENRRLGKKTSFIRFYLELYKELYLKMPVKRIAEEASKRWRAMNSKERSMWANGKGHSVS